MGAIVEAHGPLDREGRRRGRPADAYGALLRSIVGQQLSTKAARTIYGRLADLYGGRAPSPAELIETDPERLREVGLSRAKASYLRSLAEHVIAGELELDRLTDLPDEEVSAQLTAVKGLGQWTADMFLIFHLERPDVLAGRRSRREARRADRLRAGRPTVAGGARRDRRAVAAAPLARVAVPVELAGQRAGLVRAQSLGKLKPDFRLRQRRYTTLPQLGSSSATRNDDPQPQAATTFGLFTSKPEPIRLSVKSTSEPSTYWRLAGSTSRRMPSWSKT